MSAYREESIVRVRYELDSEELLRSYRESPSYRRLRNAGYVVFGAVVFVTLAMLSSIRWEIAVIGGIATAALTGLGYRRAIVGIGKKTFEDERWPERRRVELEVTDDGLEIRNGLSSSRFAWDLVLWCRESEEFLQVYTTPEMFFTIPKRALPPEALTTLRQHVVDRIGAGGERRVGQAAQRVWVPFAAFYSVIALTVGAIVEGLARLF